MNRIESYSKPPKWFLALALTALMAGCGSDSDQILGIPGGVALKPTVTATAPANLATAVATNSKVITATFSKAMTAATISGTSFTVTGPGATAVAGAVTYPLGGTTAVFTAGANLAGNTQYTATITTAAKDTGGNALASNYVWTFVTAATPDTTAPQVSLTAPADTATGVAINRKVTASFTEAMDPTTITGTSNFTLATTVGAIPVAGSVTYAAAGTTATFAPTANLTPNTSYTATITTAVKDLAGNALVSGPVPNSWTFTTALATVPPDTTAPRVSSTNPVDLATDVSVVTKSINATFTEAMDATTISSASFTLTGPGLTPVAGSLSYDPLNNIATFSPLTDLAFSTLYTATVTTGAKDLAGNALASGTVPNPWTFTTAAAPVIPPPAPLVNLATAAPYGTFGGSAGMTNTGTATQINNGDIGTIATGTTSITGFHDSNGDFYTETLANIGAVSGKIYTCTVSTTGPTSAAVNAASCAIATQGRLDAQAAYLALEAMPPVGASPAPGGNLAGLTLLPGVYKAPAGSFMIQGGDLTLDPAGDANATWVFQMATTLTVGGPGAAAPQNIILVPPAQAKNVYWQVGSAATINAAGGGTMKGTIISQSGAAFSTVGNATVTTLDGRAISLGASVTLVNTVVNVP
jgi:hypothetical protein